MITADELAAVLTADQYAALQAAINAADASPCIRVTLKQYAPEWTTSSVPAALSDILTLQTDHAVELTEAGNWRLTYQDDTLSDIYWPFQVRSLDAIAVGEYDIIAMVTDLPPIVDTTLHESGKTKNAREGIETPVLAFLLADLRGQGENKNAREGIETVPSGTATRKSFQVRKQKCPRGRVGQTKICYAHGCAQA